MNEILNSDRGKLSAVSETLNSYRGNLSAVSETLNSYRGEVSAVSEAFKRQEFSELFAVLLVLKKKKSEI